VIYLKSFWDVSWIWTKIKTKEKNADAWPVSILVCIIPAEMDADIVMQIIVQRLLNGLVPSMIHYLLSFLAYSDLMI
jgi:hypothetical protein